MCSIENLSVRTVYVRTHIPHIVSRFNLTFQIVSVIPYSGKFLPGVNFRQFRQSVQVAKI